MHVCREECVWGGDGAEGFDGGATDGDAPDRAMMRLRGGPCAKVARTAVLSMCPLKECMHGQLVYTILYGSPPPAPQQASTQLS